MNYCLPTFIALGLLTSVQPLSAQQENVSTVQEVKPVVDSSYLKPVFQRPMTVSLHLGSQGIGASVKLGVLPKVNMRVGFSLIPLNYSRGEEVSTYEADVKLKGNFSNAHVFGEYRPFAKSSFRLVAGVGYFFSGQTTVDIQPEGTFYYGEIPVTGEQIGKVKGTVDWKGIAPYLGIGIFNSMPKRKFNINIDLGTYYLAKPKTSIEGTNMLVENKSNEEQLNENLKGYRWLPVLQFNLNYRLH
jgi:hypothetical protein